MQPTVCTLVPPFLHELSSYFPSAFLLHSFVIIILELPSLLLPKPPAEGLQLEAAVRLLQFRCQTKIIFEKLHGIYEKSRERIHCGCKMTFPFIKWMPKAITNKITEGKNNEWTLFVYNSDLCWDGHKAVTTANNLQFKKGKMQMQAKAIVLCLLYKNHQRRFQYLLYNFPDTRHPSYGICSRGKPSHLSWFPQLGEYLAFFIPIKGKRNKQILQGRVPQIRFRKGDRNHLNQNRWDLQGAFGQGCVPWAPWTTLSTSSQSKRAQRRHKPLFPGKRPCPTTQHNNTSSAPVPPALSSGCCW